MSIAPTPPITMEHLLSSENRGRFELVKGHLEEVHVSNLSSITAGILLTILNNFCLKARVGYILPADGYYRCFGEDGQNARKPDISFMSAARITPDWLEQGFSTIPPDLAIEVLSPNDLAYEVNHKIKEYLQGGVRLIWCIDPVNRQVMIYRPDGSVQSLSENDTLSGENILPGFECVVKEFLGAG